MKIENIVTCTQFSTSFRAHYETTVWLQRPYRLTEAGAQRIIRRTRPDAVVTRIQHKTRQ